MRREFPIKNIEENYDFDSDHADHIQRGIEGRCEEMKNGSLRDFYDENPGAGFQLILRNMCCFPEFYFDPNSERYEVKACYSGIDPSPVIVGHNNKARQEGDYERMIPSSLHEDVDRVVDFISDYLPFSRFYRDFSPEDVKATAMAFFLDDQQYDRFRMTDFSEAIGREIESLSDKDVIRTIIPEASLSYETLKDLVTESVLTYFARKEYNSEVNSVIHERDAEMSEKLYGKSKEECDDIEKMVSQIFVAHDWMRDERNPWFDSKGGCADISGRAVDLRDYLRSGEQSLLFEIVPGTLSHGDLKGFFGGKTYMLLHEDDYMTETNDVQAADLGDEIQRVLREGGDYRTYYGENRKRLDDFYRKRPTMHVRRK